MLKLTLDADEHSIKGLLAGLAHLRDGAPKACAAAINLTLPFIRALSVRLARTVYTAKANDLSRQAKIERAKAGGLVGRVSFKDKRGMSLRNFQARPGSGRPPEGASVKVLRQGSRKRPRLHGQKAFIAAGNNGNTLMFVRLKRGAGGLKALYGPRLIQALNRDEVERGLEREASRQLSANVARAVESLLTGASARNGGRRR